MIHLFQTKNIKLHSGSRSDWKIECDALTDDDLETLAKLISKKVKFGQVIGIPKGGVRLEGALIKYVTKSPILLLVDDVLTTGNSMNKYKREIERKTGKTVMGMVIFARNRPPDWVRAIFTYWK